MVINVSASRGLLYTDCHKWISRFCFGEEVGGSGKAEVVVLRVQVVLPVRWPPGISRVGQDNASAPERVTAR